MAATGQQDYYGTLGVKRGASTEDIRKAYRRLARKFHPDLNPGDKASEDRFKHVQEAYDVLSDAKKRQMYDQFGFYSENMKPGPGPGAGAGGFNFGGFDFDDVFTRTGGAQQGPPPGMGEGFGTSFKDLFSQFFGGQRGQEPSGPERGSDLEYALNITFWQAIKGTQVRLTINRHEKCEDCRGTGEGAGGSMVCPDCNGSGSVTQMAGAMKFSLSCPRCGGRGRTKNACPRCRGEGRTARQESVEVRIPQGAANGSRLRVAAKGNAGVHGGAAGDLYITVRVDGHSLFHREGDNIELKVPITVWEAGLGAKIEVPTIDGRALLKVPPGTRSGQKFRLRERGVFNARKGGRGDQIVEVVIEAPPANDERTRELLRELAKAHHEDPRQDVWKSYDGP